LCQCQYINFQLHYKKLV